MNHWGLSGFSHDAALAVVTEYNDILFASHSERYTGNKHDDQFGQGLIDAALSAGQLTACHSGLPSNITWYENDLLKRVRQLRAGQWDLPFTEPTPLSRLKEEFPQVFVEAPVWHQHRHHLTHAAAGFATSTFNEAAVLVIDAIGEFNSATIWKAVSDLHGNCSYKLLEKVNYPHSLGLVYSAFTQRCDLRPLDEEYILMGMAAYGEPIYAAAIKRDIICIDGNSFKCHDNWHRGIGNWMPDAKPADLAASIQQVTEEIVLHMASRAVALAGSRNLVYMGGVALNCVANSQLGQVADDIWIMPNPGDAGSSIGAVAASKGCKLNWQGPYLGHDIGRPYPVEQLVESLLANPIAAVAAGRAEFGPRALGNRSLVADPRGNEIKDKVNEIKRRQKFRPFAPMILEERVHDYFEMPKNINTSPYMQFVARCKHPTYFPAIIHADGTSRVQTVNEQQHPGLYQALKLWEDKTGCPILLNTSLNIRGKPMVNTIEDAHEFRDAYGINLVV